MLRLRKILLCDYVFYLVLILVLGFTIFTFTIKRSSKYDINTNVIAGRVVEIKNTGNSFKIMVKAREKVICYYKYLDTVPVDISLNDLVLIEGSMMEIDSSGVFNTFDYKKYLKHNNIFWQFEVDSIKVLKKNRNIFYMCKSSIINLINSRKSKAYLKAFILGDTNDIDDKIISSYRDIGVSHLFAISGMHITMITTILLKLLKSIKLSEGKRYLSVSVVLFLYLFLTGIRASILRAIIFFLLLSINKYYYFYIKTMNIFIITFCFSLLYNPYYLYDVGFQFSFVVSFFLIKYQELFKNKGYIKNLLFVSGVSFLASLPITINNFYQINILSIFYNLVFVPLVSCVVFPLSLITFVFFFLDDIFMFIVNILEGITIFFNGLSFSKLIIAKLSWVNILVFYGVLFLVLELLRRKKWWSLGLIFLVIGYFYFRIAVTSKLIMVDVKQGDCILLISKGSVAMVDVGGIKNYSDGDDNNYLFKQVILPFIKSLGIKKINHLFITHGDYDHLGNSYDLVREVKVSNVYFNNGDFNYNERKLIKILDSKKVPYRKLNEGDIVNVGLFSLIQLNKYFNEENDNSMILYGEVFNYSFLLMGDASLKSENYVLSTYNLGNVDILKVGHHGSRTSSSKKFVETVNPKYSLISVGLNNKFNHPSKTVLDTLRNTCVYRTDLNGSVSFKIKRNKLQIRTYVP